MGNCFFLQDHNISYALLLVDDTLSLWPPLQYSSNSSIPHIAYCQDAD
jgi:hypothetical protein